MALARIMLRQAGVEILYAGETLGHGSTRVLHLGMLEVLAEYESAVDSERIRDGIQKNAERGWQTGKPATAGISLMATTKSTSRKRLFFAA